LAAALSRLGDGHCQQAAIEEVSMATLSGNGAMTNSHGDPGAASLVVDDIANDKFYVDRRIFSDSGIFDLEMKRIFENGWVFLGHESQIANPGDFITGFIGRVPVIVNRKPSGEIGALINSCAHRGALITRAAKGNSITFACPYHGWCYDADGRNVKLLGRETGDYPGHFDTENHDLIKVPRVSNYRGFIWGSLNAEVPELTDYLGQTRPIIDLLVDQSPQGLEVLRGSSTYTFKANWKLQMENGVDGYHFPIVHASYVMLAQQRARAGKLPTLDVRKLLKLSSGCYDMGGGHSMIWAALPNPQDRPNYNRRDELIAKHGEEKFAWMMQRMRNLCIFPNVQLMDQASSQIRIFRPISPNLTEVKIYCIAPVGESPENRALRLRQYEDFFNASGLGTADDLAVFEACQIAYDDPYGRLRQAYDRGIGSMNRGPDEDAAKIGCRPAAAGSDISHEILFHGPYRHWLKMMNENRDREEYAAR
jgi:benzoate/toluate 1,2-dioxygenase alpha subunit